MTDRRTIPRPSARPPSDAMVVRTYFFPGLTTPEVMRQMVGMTPAEVHELAEMIRSTM